MKNNLINNYSNFLKQFKSFDEIFEDTKPLYIGNNLVGFISAYNQDIIKSYLSEYFLFHQNKVILNYVFSNNYLHDFENITCIFEEISLVLSGKNIIRLRNEKIALKNRYNKIIGTIERSINTFFGFFSEGVHINGFIQQGNEKKIWVAKRAEHKLYAGKLDNLIAGCIPYPLDAQDTLKKEAQEEASLVLNYKVPLSMKIMYLHFEANKIRNDCMFVFNLELKENFNPFPQDKEVDRFYLFSLDELLSKLNDNLAYFKPNSALALIYFLVQNNYYHGELLYLLEQFFNRKTVSFLI